MIWEENQVPEPESKELQERIVFKSKENRPKIQLA